MNNPIPKDELDYLEPLTDGDGKAVLSMLELGNKKNANGTYKHHFQSLGIRHVSVDWNGEDGALALDLREPQWETLGEFDMVTNIGTTEHVTNQYGAWENIHHCCRVGGVVVSITPYHDGRSWWWHGVWYPKESFFENFAKKNGYKIIKMGKGRNIPNENLCVRMVKLEDKPFFMPEHGTMVENRILPRAHPAKIEYCK